MRIIVIAACFSALSTVFVALRLFTRFYLISHPGIDDYTITVALCFAWCSFAFLVQEVQHGAGRPTATVSPEELKLQLKALWLSIPFYNMSLTLTKAAIVFLYLRIFPTPRFILAARIVLSVIAIYGLWTVISAFLNCLPVASFWDSEVRGKCIPKAFLWFFNGGWNIATDLAILVLPIPVLSRLKLPKRQRVGVILVFATGGFACVTSMVRLNYLTVATHTTDPTRDNGPIALWSQIELNSGIICCCLPPLQPLVTRFFPRLLASASHSRDRQNRKRSGPYAMSGDSSNPDRPRDRDGRSVGQGQIGFDSRNTDGIFITHELRIERSDREDTSGLIGETESERGLVIPDVQGRNTPQWMS